MTSETGLTQAVSDGSPRSEADTRSDPTGPPPATQPGRRLLVWDAPNIDMVIGTLILRRKPTLKERPKAEMLARWLLERCEGSDVAEGCIFANTTGANFNAILGWTEFLRQMGFRVFLKPKASEDSDVDDNIVEHIEDRFEAGDLREVVVMTHDGANLGDLAGELIAAGVTVTALVFPEHANSLCAVAGIQVVDLESVTGLFETRLPRVSFATLPDEGMWLEPLAPPGHRSRPFSHNPPLIGPTARGADSPRTIPPAPFPPQHLAEDHHRGSPPRVTAAGHRRGSPPRVTAEGHRRGSPPRVTG